MGDAASGKTEFLCMLQDMERDPKGKTELSLSKGVTPSSKTENIKVEVLNQTIAFCDGPGAVRQQLSRMNYILNNPVQGAIDRNERLVLVYMIDMSKNDESLHTACKSLLSEVGMFFKGFEQIYIEKKKYSGPKNIEVSDETIARAGGKVLVLGTHMDKINNQETQRTNALISEIEEKKMKVSLSPFLKDVKFEFVFGDLYSFKGRCDFLKKLGDALKC